MIYGIRISFKRASGFAAIALLAMAGALTIDFSWRLPEQPLMVSERILRASSVTTTQAPNTAAHPALKLAMNYGKLPLSFEPNEGQTDQTVKFLSHGRGYSLFLTGDEAVLAMASRPAGKEQRSPFRNSRHQTGNLHLSPKANIPSLQSTSDASGSIQNPKSQIDNSPPPSPQYAAREVIRLRLVGANPGATVSGGAELAGKVNYFIGKDPGKWRIHVPTYAQVGYHNVYPGVDLEYHGSQNGNLEYDFIVAPGADPAPIAWALEAASQPDAANSPSQPLRPGSVRIDANGDLALRLDGADVRFQKPVVYQEQESGEYDANSDLKFENQKSKIEKRKLASFNHQSQITNRKFLEGRYVLTASNQVRFALGPYDHSKPLVIDPVLNYASYLGGSSANLGNGIAVDSSGDAYVVGYTFSTDFPTQSPLQSANGSHNGQRNAFVTEFNPTGSALVYSTYLGGSGDDVGYGIAVDSSQEAYVIGTTTSSNFPITGGSFQTTQPGSINAFVAKLSSGGAGLAYSTYLGGNNQDYGQGIAIDTSGNAYLTGYTSSSNFPTVNAYQSSQPGSTNAFVTKLNPAGSALIYSTYLGGNYLDYGQGIAIDSSGNAYVTGYTSSGNFPTVNAFQPNQPGTTNPFVAKLNPSGNALVYSTYLGSYEFDYGYGIAVNSAGNAFVTGATDSYYFPIAGNAYQSNYNGGVADAFIAELNTAGNGLVYSTYLGGSGQDEGQSIALDPSGDAFVTGWTFSTDFPTVNAFQSAHGNDHGESDAFVAMLNGAGSSLTYSSYLGGNSYDWGYGIALDSTGNAYVTGQTSSSDFPVTGGAFQTNNTTETQDAFVAQVQAVPLSPAINLSPNPLPFGNQPVGTTSSIQSVTLSNDGTGLLQVTSITVTGDYAFATTGTSCPYTGGSVVSGGTCTIDLTFTPATTGTLNGTVTVTDNAGGSPQTVSLTGTGTPAAPMAGVSPSLLTFTSQAVGTTSASQPVTLSNTGSAALTITSVATSANFGQTNNCGGSVAAGGSCTINVTFTPTAGGTLNGTLTVTDNNNGMAGSTQSVSLSGTGEAPLAGVAPPSLAFGNQLVGTTSASQPVTLSNSGSAPLTVTSIAASANFGQTNNCGGSVAAGGSCTINVTFTPTANGALSGTLTVTDNSNGVANSTQTVSLGGTGTTPLAGVAPMSLAFGSQSQGTTSASQPVILSNSGTAPLTITNIAASTNFGQTNNCGGSVAAGASCTINVTFIPTAGGALSGTLTVTDNSNGVSGTTQTVNLSGTGTGAPVATLNPSTTLSVGNTVVTSTSASQPVTLGNIGSATLLITNVAVSTGFAQTNNCGGSLAAGNSCTINVTFSPSAPGAFSGVLTVTDNNNGVTGSTQSLNLSGTGVDFSVTSPTGAQTVGQGGKAVYTINVGSVGGTFSNAVTLACSNLPAATTCAIATNSVTPGASGASTQLTLSTSAPTVARGLPPLTGNPPSALPVLLLAGFFTALTTFRRACRRSPRWAAASCLVFGALLAMTLMVGCGGGGSGSGFPLPTTGGTPVGTYTITVTGTSGSTQHSTTITLTVTAS